MPLGWGRAIGSYVGSHFGSLGRPPGTKKGILQLYNNEHGLSSSTQLQNYNAIDDRKSIHTSIENANSEFDNQHSSEKDYKEDERSQNDSQTINLGDGFVESNYVRGLQIGAILALGYNLFSAHFRLRAIQAQKPILTGNSKKTQLLVPTEKKIPSLLHLDQNGNKHFVELKIIYLFTI